MGRQARRLKLHKTLKRMLGTSNVYFQPPPSIKIHYPCIVYNFDGINLEHADNDQYLHRDRYNITVITSDVFPDICDELMTLPYCRFNRMYSEDNLNHYSYSIYLLEE